jgi:hypothetical protein
MDTRTLAGLLLTVGLSGCVVEANDAPYRERVGALIVDWTIDGSKSVEECNLSGSSTLDVTIVTSSGAVAGEFQQACESFATTITLAPGSYSGQAVLLDGAGRERTTSVQIRPFEVFSNDQLSIPIEFPANSFYAP